MPNATNNTNSHNIMLYLMIITLITGITIIILINSFVQIPAGHKGILLEWSAIKGLLLEPGLVIKNPISEQIQIVDIRTKIHTEESSAASKDLQIVTTQMALNYHINAMKVLELYQQVGLDIENKIISPAVDESIKATTAQFSAEELITRREEVKINVTEILTERLAEFNIILDEFSITNMDFSPEFNRAIEAKQVAEQEALQAKRILEKVGFEAEQKVVQAQAEATAVRMRAYADAEAIEVKAKAEAEAQRMLRQELDANMLKKIYYERWNGVLPQYILGDSNLLLELPTTSGEAN